MPPSDIGPAEIPVTGDAAYVSAEELPPFPL